MTVSGGTNELFRLKLIKLWRKSGKLSGYPPLFFANFARFLILDIEKLKRGVSNARQLRNRNREIGYFSFSPDYCIVTPSFLHKTKIMIVLRNKIFRKQEGKPSFSDLVASDESAVRSKLYNWWKPISERLEKEKADLSILANKARRNRDDLIKHGWHRKK